MKDLPTDPTCVVGSGQSITILQEGYRLPDGTTTTSIDNCTFESGSSVVMEDPEPPVPEASPVTPVTLPATITPVIPTYLPKSFSPPIDEGSVDNPLEQTAVVISIGAPVITSPATPSDSEVPGALVVAAVAAVAVTAAATSGVRGKGRGQKSRTTQQRQQERERQQKECTTKSDRVSSKIQDLVDMAQRSRTNSLEIRDPVELYEAIEEVDQEVASLNRMVKNRGSRKVK